MTRDASVNLLASFAAFMVRAAAGKTSNRRNRLALEPNRLSFDLSATASRRWLRARRHSCASGSPAVRASAGLEPRAAAAPAVCRLSADLEAGSTTRSAVPELPVETTLTRSASLS